MSAFDWPALQRAGLNGLNLRPVDFWALTPRELQVMLGAEARPALGRSGLQALMQAYPDGASLAETDGGNDGTGRSERADRSRATA